MEKSFLYFITKIVAIISSILLFLSAKVDVTVAVISTLSFACIFVLELLLEKLHLGKRLLRVTIGFCIIICFVLGIEQLFPLYIVLVIHLLDSIVEDKMFYSILTVVILLSYFIFLPNMISIVITFGLASLLLFCRYILNKLFFYQQRNEEQKETIAGLNKKLTDVKSLAKTIKYNASVEERNRIAARIHDQVGHGISGSIILLEAALLMIKEQPEKAEESIRKAAANLREGVDDIRTSLKSERVEQDIIGMTDIQAVLEEFRVNYNKETEFRTTGALDTISLEIWGCIHDNLKECLTNLLKHSNATKFTLSIDAFKKIIKVEYKDNGYSEEGFEKGLGLDAIAERTVKAKGKCFFNKGERGFSVTNIFMI